MTNIITPATIYPLPLEILCMNSDAIRVFDQRGYNRKPGQRSVITATNDLEAVSRWLDEFKVSPKTYRSYRKEVERFCNWLVMVSQKSLSSIKIDDIDAYLAFMAHPLPENAWVSRKRHVSRHSPFWRPFEKPASVAAQSYASVVLSGLFAYLRDVGYLYESPFAAKRLKAKKIMSGKGQREQPKAVIQYLPASLLKRMFALFESAIDELDSTSSQQQRLQLERYLFITRFLANTGLRGEEIAHAVMSDVYSQEFENENHWYIRVHGKGDKVRHVPLSGVARASLTRYLRATDRQDQFLGNHTPLFLPVIRRTNHKNNTVSPRTIYETIKSALKYASTQLQTVNPDDAYKLEIASPHKFRHAFATISAEVEGMTTAMIQDILGHASMETTRIYLHTDLKSTAKLIKNTGI